MRASLTAFDENGNTFKKFVTFKTRKQGKVLSFGYPVEYNLKTLLRHYPLKRDLCIDAAGLNHKNAPTYIRKDDLNELLGNLLKDGAHA